MKNNQKLAALVLAMAVLAGCGGAASAAQSTAAAESQPARPVRQVMPFPLYYSTEEPVQDGIYAVGLPADEIEQRLRETQDGVALRLDFYQEDRYDAAEIAQLAPGDTLTIYGETLTVEQLERAEDGVRLVNGVARLAPDEGGTFVSLQPNANVYYYTLVGSAEVALGPDFALLAEGEAPVPCTGLADGLAALNGLNPAADTLYMENGEALSLRHRPE